MTKPLYFYNGTTFELVGPTTPQSPIAYQTSAPTAPATGDLWIDSDGDVDTYNRQLTRYYYVATAAQTTITGIDANGLTLAYVAGSEAVYVNGALQVRGQDYTATNGTSVVMSSALAVNDVVEIFAYTAFTVANAYTKSETDGLVNTSAGLKLLTPTSIAVGSGSGSVSASGTVTFSAVSSLSLNGVFSSTYDNYLIQFNNVLGNAGFVGLRLRTSTDETSSQYFTQEIFGGGSSLSATRTSSATSWAACFRIESAVQNLGSMVIYNPFNTVVTTAQTSLTTAASGTGIDLTFSGRGLNTTTSYTGFTIIPSSNNITGSISVYGYKE